jgi:membrane protein YdbS with pleckstrin-like domain
VEFAASDPTRSEAAPVGGSAAAPAPADRENPAPDDGAPTASTGGSASSAGAASADAAADEYAGSPADGGAAAPPAGRGTSSAVEAAFAAPAGAEWNRVSPMLAWYRRIMLLAVVIPAVALGGGVLWLWSWPWAVAWMAAALAAGAAGWFAAATAWRSWGYAEGPTDFYLTYGIVIRQLVVVPYGRMQVVDVTSNLLEQALGMATVRVRTAATTADTRIPGLRLDDAVVLRDRLATRSETFSTGL